MMINGCLNLNVEFEWTWFKDDEYINILVDIVALWELYTISVLFWYVWENIVLKFKFREKAWKY